MNILKHYSSLYIDIHIVTNLNLKEMESFHDTHIFLGVNKNDSLCVNGSLPSDLSLVFDQDVGGGRGVCCQGLSEVEVHSMEDILEVVRRAQARWGGVNPAGEPGEPQW